MSEDYAALLAEKALENGAIRLSPDNPFTWASGYRMPIYNDNRQFLADWKSRAMIADAFCDLLAQTGYDPQNIAGTSTAGIPHATTLADRLHKSLSYVRSASKDHGLHQKIEGLDASGSYHHAKVLLIEDLISTGGSSVDAVTSIVQAEGSCDYCFAIFTYGLQASTDAFAALLPACTLKTILDYPTLLFHAEKRGYLTSAQVKTLAAWREDPFGWGEANGWPKEEKK
ncbi:MAG: orotate phosphoribosyltransferase [Sphaerochaeta sp.]|jgi:orotate phosphoribosyltransferase|nr:orotate phosphoribosyltransferase [Sphaerochaeta sp.]